MTRNLDEFFHAADGLASLIIHRYPSRLPPEIVDELETLSARARALARLGLGAEISRLRDENAELRAQLTDLERMDGER